MLNCLINAQNTGAENPKELRGKFGDRGGRHGMASDYVLRHRNTNKAVFVDIERQRAKGGAHERPCKLMMPGILDSIRLIGDQPDSVIPA